MRHGSLFSGIGGFDLAAEWMGWENVFQVEIDPWCRKILKKNFPNAEQYGDIKEFRGERGSVDILSGGFPCQPFSHAGKRKGESDDRYLWPEYLRIIREIQPTYVVGENVAGLVSMEDGKTLEGIFSDLEGEGYTVESFIIPACGVGAWHRRDRIWIIGYTQHYGPHGPTKSGSDEENDPERRQEEQGKAPKSKGTGQSGNVESGSRGKGRGQSRNGNNTQEDVPDTGISGLQGVSKQGGYGEKRKKPSDEQFKGCNRGWEMWNIEPDVGRVAPRFSSTLDETLNDYGYENTDYKEAFAEIDKFRRSIMRDMWYDGRKIEPPSYRTESGQGDDFMHSMSHRYSHERWKLGQRIEKEKELCNMWVDIYSKPFKETQDLQSEMLERIREIERNEKVESSRMDRLKGLGNAIVPQVVFEIFKAIKELDEQNKSM